MNELEVKKELFKSKEVAKLSHYVSGNLYYTVKLESGVYQFPISTIQKEEVMDSFEREFIPTIKLSEDLGTTTFSAEMRGSELNRWIVKAIKSGEFIKVSE
jgi:hypothetical protein